MTRKEISKLKKEWLEEVYNKAEQVDADEEYVWEGVAVGWLIGKGVDIEKAIDIAMFHLPL